MTARAGQVFRLRQTCDVDERHPAPDKIIASVYKTIHDFLAKLVGSIPVVKGVNFWVEWGPLIIVIVVWLALVALGILLIRRVSYRIGAKTLQVTLLGIPIRWVRFDNIRNIHTRRVRIAEKWRNQIFIRYDRILVIEKRRGLFRHFEITPEQRYVFKAELDRAIRAFMGMPPAPTAATTNTFENLAAAGVTVDPGPPPGEQLAPGKPE